MASLSLIEEETLTEVIRNYPVLYDKAHKGYKEKDAVANAWTEVASLLDFVEDGEKARIFFMNFKKRYSKKKTALKNCDKSRTSSAAVEKAKRDFRPYSFFTWIDEFLKSRTTTTNVAMRHNLPFENSPLATEDVEEDDSEDDESKSIDSTQSSKKATKRVSSVGKERRPSKFQKLSAVEERQMKIMEEMERDIMSESASSRERDGIDAYCEAIASDMRRLSDIHQCMVKHEINGILFKYRMMAFQQTSQQAFSPNVQSTPVPRTHTEHIL